ncbi:MAG: hypothetical protein ACYDGR_17300 [Candidatus Dormibacteria bacterium]
MNYCPSCGAALVGDSPRCASCGANLGAEQTPAAASDGPKTRKRGRTIRFLVGLILFALGAVLGWALDFPTRLIGVAVVGTVLSAVTLLNPGGVGRGLAWVATRLPLPGLRKSSGRGRAGAFLAIDLVFLPVLGGMLSYSGSWLVNDRLVYVHVSGFAMIATPLLGSTVNIFELQSNGQRGAMLGTATTDKDGGYSTTVHVHRLALMLVATSGGTYNDEISGKAVQATAAESLQTVRSMWSVPVPPSGDEAAAKATPTPLTTMATARMLSMAADGVDLRTSGDTAFGAVARQYDLTTINDNYPAVSNSASDVAIADRESRKAGLILAALDTEANDLGVTDFGLTMGLAQDLSDGNLDGKKGSIPVLLEPHLTSLNILGRSQDIHLAAGPGPQLQPNAGTLALQAALDRFSGSPANQAHLNAYKILGQSPEIYLVNGGLFVDQSGLPLWVDGQAGSTRLSAGGGNPPYMCDLLNGPMPPHFTFGRDCTISYDGTPVLGTSTMRVVGPWRVVMVDTPTLPILKVHTVQFDLPGLTIVTRPPALQVMDIVCPHAGQACAGQVAAATGGAEPNTPSSPRYSFSAYGDVPFVMFMGLHDGVLSGTPHRPGRYKVGVCVTDSAGGQTCQDPFVVVGDVATAPEATPAPQCSPGDTYNPSDGLCHSQAPHPTTCPPAYPIYNPANNKCYAQPPAHASYDGVYDYTFQYPTPGGLDTRTLQGYVRIAAGVLTSADGQLHGQVSAGGAVTFTVPCPVNPGSATGTGTLDATSGSGGGQYQCNEHPMGVTPSWRLSNRR